ncbi:MAG: PIN domain-containing protein [Candidatus Cloacimonadota bacterium]|nr:PIN domain-containing protein [Candidatus Cloacimonadota bacterium]
MKYLLDTNGLIYLLSGKGKFPDFMLEDEMFISFISYIELLAGIKKEEIKVEVQVFLQDFKIIYSDKEITEITLKFREKLGLKIPDAIIGAAALQQKSILITSDKKMISKLSSEMKIIDPFSKTNN